MIQFKKNDLFIENDKVLDATIKFIIIIIGVSGNSMNLFVLTRNKIKTTTIYLIAISAVDLLRLLSAISNSLEFFQWIHLDYELYWKCRPIIECVTYSTQAMSLLLIVSFSINRYIAIKHSFKRNILNTKTASRCLVIGIVIICVLTRVPIVINIVSKEFVGYNELTHKFCKLNSTIEYSEEYETNQTNFLEPLINMKSKPLNTHQLQEQLIVKNHTDMDSSENILNLKNITNNYKNCKKIIYYMAVFRSHNRPSTWYRLIIVTLFGLIPTLTLIGFNIKLILILRKSNLNRLALTNSVILQQKAQQRNQHIPLISKENRAILQLITIKAVIALLRLPYFILMYFLPIIIKYDKNAFKIIRQISSTTLDLNAALNFFLFCILPSYYRKQFVDTMSSLCCKHRNSNIENKQNIKESRPIEIDLCTDSSIGFNLAFVNDNLNTRIPISVISSFPGNQPPELHYNQQLQQSEQKGQLQYKHRKLKQFHSISSSSSGSTYSSQFSQNSETSKL